MIGKNKKQEILGVTLIFVIITIFPMIWMVHGVVTGTEIAEVTKEGTYWKFTPTPLSLSHLLTYIGIVLFAYGCILLFALEPDLKHKPRRK